MINVEKSIPSTEDMVLINGLAKAEMSPEDVFTFSVMCCDTRVDRDQERFTVDALSSLSKLYVGKPIIRDHSPRADNQIGRIFKSYVREANDGESELIVEAYIPITDSNAAVIQNIEAGVLKEVSVSCSVRKRICSVCGKISDRCGHIKGKMYKGKSCFCILDDIADVYELSFVAVPAQRAAGVIKTFSGPDPDPDTDADIIADDELIGRLAAARMLTIKNKISTVEEEITNENEQENV